MSVNVRGNQCDLRQKVCSHLRGGLPHMAAHRYGTVYESGNRKPAIGSADGTFP